MSSTKRKTSNSKKQIKNKSLKKATVPPMPYIEYAGDTKNTSKNNQKTGGYELLQKEPKKPIQRGGARVRLSEHNKLKSTPRHLVMSIRPNKNSPLYGLSSFTGGMVIRVPKTPPNHHRGRVTNRTGKK